MADKVGVQQAALDKRLTALEKSLDATRWPTPRAPSARSALSSYCSGEPNQCVRYHLVAGANRRVRCFSAEHHTGHARQQAVGYAGRLKSIAAVEAGANRFAALCAPPANQRGAGVWARHANLERVHPVLTVERKENSDVYVVVGGPIPASEMRVARR